MLIVMLFLVQRSLTCPNCRSDVIHTDLIKLFLPEDERFQVKTKEELELLMQVILYEEKINCIQYKDDIIL